MTCDQNKILNPKTKRCVKIDSRLGKQLMLDQHKNDKVESSQKQQKRRILAVCAIADRKDSIDRVITTVRTLFKYNCTHDEIYVCNKGPIVKPPLIPTKNVISKWFGQDKMDSKFAKHRFDIIIFQGCMIMAPFTFTSSVFNDFNVYNELLRVLSPEGHLVINEVVNKPLYDGRGVDIRPILDLYFDKSANNTTNDVVYSFKKNIIDSPNRLSMTSDT